MKIIGVIIISTLCYNYLMCLFQWRLNSNQHLHSSGYGKINGDEDFADLAASGLLEVAGNDQQGRLIVVVSACRLPKVTDVPPDKLYRSAAASLSCDSNSILSFSKQQNSILLH